MSLCICHKAHSHAGHVWHNNVAKCFELLFAAWRGILIQPLAQRWAGLCAPSGQWPVLQVSGRVQSHVLQ